jgi:hypothetical protein
MPTYSGVAPDAARNLPVYPKSLDVAFAPFNSVVGGEVIYETCNRHLYLLCTPATWLRCEFRPFIHFGY